MGSASAHNASLHSASTKHGPAHPRDVDDVDGRRPHDVDDRYTRLSQAHHTSSTKAHSPSTHSTGTCRRQGPEHAHADDKPHRHERTERTEEEEGEEEDTPRTQHGHAGVRSVKRTAAGSAVPRPCLRSLAAVGRRRLGAVCVALALANCAWFRVVAPAMPPRRRLQARRAGRERRTRPGEPPRLREAHAPPWPPAARRAAAHGLRRAQP